jgi:hypothetical protein
VIGNGTSILSAISRSLAATAAGSPFAASRNNFATSRRTHSTADGMSVTEMDMPRTSFNSTAGAA